MGVLDAAAAAAAAATAGQAVAAVAQPLGLLHVKRSERSLPALLWCRLLQPWSGCCPGSRSGKRSCSEQAEYFQDPRRQELEYQE